MHHLFCHWYLFAVVCLLATENACPRLLQVAKIFLQDVTCLTSRYLLFSSTFTWSKESANSSDVTCFSEGVIWTSFSCSASSLFADHVTNPSSQLQVTVTQINIPVLCIVLVTFLPSPSEGHSDLIPNPLSAHHASNVHDNPQTCPRGVLAMTFRGLTLAFQQITVIHRCHYHPEEWHTTGLECVWASPCFHFPLFSSHSEGTQLPHCSKLSHQDQEVLRLPTNWYWKHQFDTSLVQGQSHWS